MSNGPVDKSLKQEAPKQFQAKQEVPRPNLEPRVVKLEAELKELRAKFSQHFGA